MPQLSSRRRPYPYDVRISLRPPEWTPDRLIGSYRGQTIGAQRGTLIGQTRGTSSPFDTSQGFMLVPSQSNGLMVGKKQTNLAPTYPPAAEYGSAPVYRERTFMFSPTGGMGEATQSSGQDPRYHYGIDVWVAGGYFGQGPKVHSLVPSGVDQMVRRFIEGPPLGTHLVDSLYVLAGTYVYRVEGDLDDEQMAVMHKGGIAYAMDAARFTGAYAGAVDAIYVAWNDGTIDMYDGATQLPCALPPNFNPTLLEVVGDELWACDTQRCHIRKCTADPRVAGNWSGPILIGNPSTKINAIRQTTNRLAIFKDDGDVFTINQDGSDNDLFPGLRNTRAPDTGRTAWSWLGSLWFRAGEAFYRLDMQGGPTLTPVGPERIMSNQSPVHGPVQAFCGWNEQLAFCVVYNPHNATSYLLSYGQWLPPEEAPSEIGFKFIDQYDGALAHWPNRKASAMWIHSRPGEDRLYIGFVDGGYDWIRIVPFPFAPNSGAEFSGLPATIVLPIHHAMFQADPKHTVGFSVFGPAFNPGDRVDVYYRLAGSAGLPPTTPSGDFVKLDQSLTSNGARFNVMRPLVGYGVEVKAVISNAGQTDRSPVLEGLGVHERLVPTFRRDFSMTVNANDRVARRDGATMRQDGVRLRDLLVQAASQPGLLAVQLVDEQVWNVALFDYAERLTPHQTRGGLGAMVDIQLTEFRITDVYGIIRRFRGTRIGDWRGYSIGTMRYM